MKLYIVVLKSLSVGLKAAQACHAMHAFTLAYPEKCAAWHEQSSNIVVLEQEDIGSTADLLEAHGLALVRFHEPDMDDVLTAFCVEPAAKRLVRDLSLAA